MALAKDAATKSAQSSGSRQAGSDPSLSQLDKFKAAARELGTDDDPERFRKTVKKIAVGKLSKESLGS